MWDLLNVSIPAVALVPLMAITFVAWFFLQQNAKSSDIRKAEFRRLQRLAMEEHERAERELENEYMRHSQVDSRKGNVSFRGEGAPAHGYGISRVDRYDVGRGDWRDSEAESRSKNQAEKVEYTRRNVFEEDSRRTQPETEDCKRREFCEDTRTRQTEEEVEWQRRKADLEAQAKREAEEESKRRASADDEKMWEEQESQESPRHAQSVPNLNCIVCQKPTKRRCSRCKSISYWYALLAFPVSFKAFNNFDFPWL